MVFQIHPIWDLKFQIIISPYTKKEQVALFQASNLQLKRNNIARLILQITQILISMKIKSIN